MFATELNAAGRRPVEAELQEVMDNIQNSTTIDSTENDRARYQASKGKGSGSKGKRTGNRGEHILRLDIFSGFSNSSPYVPTPASNTHLLGYHNQAQPDLGVATNSARSQSLIEGDAAYLAGITFRELHVTLTSQHFMDGDRHYIETNQEPDPVSLTSLYSWVQLELLNITATRLNKFAWTCLIRALQAFYRSQQGVHELALMRPLLQHMHVGDILDLA